MNPRITVNPNIHFGKPCIAGTRISAFNVLELVNEGVSFDEIVRDYYPDLEVEDIRACISYEAHIAALYAEFADEDRELAEQGLEDYLRGLLEEDSQ